MNGTITRRGFLAVSTAGALTAVSARRVHGADDTLRLGLIGCGNRGTELLFQVLRHARAARGVRIVAVCDVFDPRKERAQAWTEADRHHRWQEVVERPDVDGVIVATPDHWHAAMAIAAMETGKDVYCEKPMTLYVEEAKALRDCAARTGRVVQIGTQHTSEAKWHKGRELIEAGVLGKVLWCQGSYTHNSIEGEWNRPIEKGASPDTIDWDAFLGSAPKRPLSLERFFCWRKFWDYSGGIATNLNYDKLAPLLLAIGPEFPGRVSAAGGVCMHDGREAPDTLVMTAEYRSGHTIVIASSMANANRLPTVIRGHEGTMEFQGGRLMVTPEAPSADPFEKRYGDVKAKTFRGEPRLSHLANWFECIRTRQPCVCDPELGYRTMAAIRMSVDAYRMGKTLYFDIDTEAVIASPPRVLPASALGTA